MSTLLAGRFLASYGRRHTSKFFAISRLYQHSYAATTKNSLNKLNDSPVNPVTTGVIPTFRRAAQYGDRTSIVDCYGDYTYKGIFRSSRQLAADISNVFDGAQSERVAFLCPNNASFVITQWACWMSGQIAVPLSNNHPLELLEHYVRDSEAGLLVTTAEYADRMKELSTRTGKRLMIVEDLVRKAAMKPAEEATETPAAEDVENYEGGLEPEFYNDADALIIYTSGTTGTPKGVVLSHSNLQAQVATMAQAWEWSPKDIVLHALPLYHMHGIVNALLTPLTAGARCVMLEKFDAAEVWSSLLAIRTKQVDRPTIFMGVPTMYALLVDEYDKIFANNPRMKEYVHAICSEKIRLMTSGSAPLPPTLHNRWYDITGQRLLERYGMSETGMILANPLHGERRPGFVGTPMPSVEVRIAEKTLGATYEVLVKGTAGGSTVVAPGGKPCVGELLVRGPSVFKQYYKRPKATIAAFSPEGWFKTGDTCQYVDGAYQLLGRTSVDIVKTGGYKVSALEVEAKLLTHPDITDCAVVGLPDLTWGQKVAAIVVAKEGSDIALTTLRDWSKAHLAPYAIPTVLKVVPSIPKNGMGKVNKKELVEKLFPESKEAAT